jgi:hypothetical protein
MALINCNECNREISDKAESCIHCGGPVCKGAIHEGPICPKCESIDVTVDTKGFGLIKAAAGAALLGPVGLLGGVIGSKKTIFVCGNCGNRWKPYVAPPDW